MRAAKADGIPIKARQRGNLATPSRALKPAHFSIGIKLLQHRLLTMGGMPQRTSGGVWDRQPAQPFGWSTGDTTLGYLNWFR